MTQDGENGARKVEASEWLKEMSPWKGTLNGTQWGVGVTILNYTQANRGDGPKLHVHKYDEIFIVRRGRGLFWIGDARIEASEGDVLLGPANVPHTFKNIGDTPLETIDIHLSDHMAQEWIEIDDPDW